ncbi:MAG: hypothetical protein NTW58_08575 [Actinobacteria bacterium]|nr:hypothetical protein [Actinomycetota bacterium]
MRKTIVISTLTAVVIAGAVMAFAGVTAPRSNATSGLCHATSLSITAPATATAGSTVAVTGSEAQTPQHTVKATLQSRLSTSKKWVNGASANLSGASYSLNWKAPAKKGTYKVRVRVAHLSASNASAVKTVVVK